MTDILWIAILAQIAMGAFDTIYHHETTERLAWRPAQRTELNLHGVRNLAYAVMFLALGWTVPQGGWAVALLALLTGELAITLWDFVEEDRTRALPASERVTHTLLTLNYGVILAQLVPWLLALTALPSAAPLANYGVMSWLCVVAAVSVIVCGLRDLAAARRTMRLGEADPAGLAAALWAHQSVLVTGGTGFVGSRLVEALAAAGCEVTVLTRSKRKAAALAAAGPIRFVTSLDQIASDARIDAVVNLAGESISDRPWTRAKRLAIVRSRLLTTRAVARLIARLDVRPAVLVSGSAVGWYGLQGAKPLSEASPGVPCFSRRVCVSWERAARRAAGTDVRLVLLRTGLVLDRSGGMLARMLTPFEFGLGGRFGDGRQWMSWIHRDDLVRLIIHALTCSNLAGPVNAVAPQPVTNRRFTTALGQSLNRPAVVPIPGWPLRLALGAFADELLLSGQRVSPDAALRHGFDFLYPTIEAALGAITGASSPPLVARPQPAARLVYARAASAAAKCAS